MNLFKSNPIKDNLSAANFGKQVDYTELNFSNLGADDLANISNLNPNYSFAAVIRTIEAGASIEVLGKLYTSGFQPILGTDATAGVRVITSGPLAVTPAQLEAQFDAIGVYVGGDGVNLPYSNVNLANITVNSVTIGQDNTYPYGQGGQGGPTYFF